MEEDEKVNYYLPAYITAIETKISPRQKKKNSNSRRAIEKEDLRQSDTMHDARACVREWALSFSFSRLGWVGELS